MSSASVQELQNGERRALLNLVTARNKLIEDLIAEIPETERAFQKALFMRQKAWEQDVLIWGKAREEV